MKAKIRKTGEVVDVICYNGYTERLSTDRVSYIDSNGREVARENLNFYWDFEPMEPAETTINKGIDWEQRRYEIAKQIFTDRLNRCTRDTTEMAAEKSIMYADMFIDKLRDKQ